MRTRAEDFTVGWVCALRTELVAAIEHLDEIHESSDYEAAPNDNNTYVFGNIGKHNIVIATLPCGEYGISNAASVARDMVRSFTNVRIGFMVGIGGGAPLVGQDEKRKQDICLGDVVVSKPGDTRGGVLQYDYGKTIQERQFKLTGHLNSPPQSILAAINVLGADFERKGNMLDEDVATLLSKNKKIRKVYQRPDQISDRLYKSSFVHGIDNESCSEVCNEVEHIIQRNPRSEDEDIVTIHEGLIASANQLMKDAFKRDKLARELGVLCFEMEAAGLMNQFPFLVVRGICDYSDTHKNKEWQGYAAMTAAAYTRKLLLKLSPSKVAVENRLSELTEIKEQLQEFSIGLDGIRRDLLQHTTRNLEAETERWLAASDPETNFQTAKDQREPGTGRWLVESENYLRWKMGAIRHLWLQGKAGCGKSVACASIIEDVQDFCANDAHTSYAIFYFTFSDSSKQSHSGCLRSIVRQLSRDHSVMASVEELFKMSKDRQDRGSRVEENLQKILVNRVRSYERFFLILDALDESPETGSNGVRQREKLLEWLQSLSAELPMLQILVTSRHSPDIQAWLIEMNFHTESMITGFVNIDINKYVGNQLKQDRRLRELNADMKKKIQDTFMEKADGMFRWAACSMNDLKRLPSTRPSDLEKALKNLPNTLDETYNRMINNIPVVVHNDALVLLRWLTYSRRPLTLLELSETRIIDLDAANGNVFFDDRGDPRDVLEILLGLVLIVGSGDTMMAGKKSSIKLGDVGGNTQKALPGDKALHRSVRLAHFSVQEYLESPRESINRPPSFHFRPEREHQILSHCCALYLMHYADTKSITRTPRDLENFSLLEYTARCWYTHCQETDDIDKEFQFIQSGAFLDGLLIYDPDIPSYQPFEKYAELKVVKKVPLYYAALVGLTSVVKKLIMAKANINTRGGHNGNALQAAAFKGHDSIVEMLIGAGAVSNAQALSSSGSSAKGNFTVTFQEVIGVSRVMEGKKGITPRSPFLIILSPPHMITVLVFRLAPMTKVLFA